MKKLYGYFQQGNSPKSKATKVLHNKSSLIKHLFVLLMFVLVSNGVLATNYYTYQSGNWNFANTWTTDPSGTELVGSAVPSNGDQITILNPYTVTLTGDVATTNNTLIIESGATLNLAGFRITTNLTALSGSGTIKSSYVDGSFVGYFPSVTLPINNTFVSATIGGTYEFTYNGANASFYLPSQATYNNLKINAGAAKIAILGNNVTLNGNLEVAQGLFQINDATARTLTVTVNGNVTVQTSGQITTGTGNTGTGIVSPYHSNAHQFIVYGDFTNNGTVKFTNQASPVYNAFPNNGAVTLKFTGATDNIAQLYGVTNFYNLIVDKGSDQNYVLEIYSSNVANFKLFGRNDCGDNESAPYSLENPEVRKALWIKNGTLKLTGKIDIPTLSEGAGGGGGNGDWRIGANAKLWISSPYVSVSTTATSLTLPGGTGVVDGVSHSALSVFGCFQISSGYLTTNNGDGVVFWNGAANTAEFIVEGGAIDASCFASTGGTGKGSYYQSGGVFTVRGSGGDYPTSDYDSSYPLFGIKNPECSFTMTGGEIKMVNNSTASVANGGNGFTVLSSVGNYNVTGGKLNVVLNSAIKTTFDINTTANLWNVDFTRSGSTAVTINLLQPLIVSNDLLIGDGTTLDAWNDVTAADITAGYPSAYYNLSVGGDFTLGQTTSANGAAYTYRTNTTTFTGSGNSLVTVFRNDNLISPLAFNNLSINKANATDLVQFVSAGRSTTAGSAGNVVATVNGTLTNDVGSLDYAAFSLAAKGNVVNNSILGPSASTGRLLLNGTALQTISSTTFTTHSIGTLELNNTIGTTAGVVSVQLLDNETVNKLILSQDRVFDIGSLCLTVGAGGISPSASFGINRHIRCDGVASAGGLKRYIDNTYNSTTVLFPLGTKRGPKTGGTVYDYFPARAIIGTVTTLGYVTVVPVADYHPSIDVSKTNYQNSALDYYWKTKINSLVVSGTNNFEFDYYQQISNGYNDPYWLINSAWASGTGVNNSPTLKPTAMGLVQADVTAGKSNPYKNPTTYYSRATGNWEALSGGKYTTWSTDAVLKHTGAAATSLPAAYDNIVIGDGVTYNHTVTRSSNTINSALVTINAGSTLDIGTTTDHTLDVVSGQGTLRISSAAAIAVFPTGDFGSFLGETGGTVEYYSTGSQDFDIPSKQGPTQNLTTIKSYYNLTFVPSNGRWIAMPDVDVEVYNDFYVKGIGAGSGWINWRNTSRTFVVDRDFVVQSGQFIFYNNPKQTHLVRRNLVVNSGASINGTYLFTSGGIHSFIIYGDLINNGSCNFNDANACDVTFLGNTSTSITGTTGTLTKFRNVTVNKGTSQATVLTVDVAGTLSAPATNWLTLTNGTLKFLKGSTLDISSTSFSIPKTACLHIENSSALLRIANSADGDLFLNGKLKIVSGRLNVGPYGNSQKNNIEYSASGSSEIEISGPTASDGNLYVNGQIRRSTTNLEGVLKYTQSTGSVNIYGVQASVSRGKFEVANPGSSFTLTGGTLTIVLGGTNATRIADLYLHPASVSTAPAGKIIFATPANGWPSATYGTFLVDADVPLSGLTVTGTSGVAATAKTSINPLVINGDLIISNAYSTFNTNNLNLTFTGNLANSGTFTAGTTDVTTFNGATQTITGSNTTFCNLAINPTTSVTLLTSSNITVNKELRILSGVLSDNGNTITAKGNIINNATHTSTASGKILLNGTTIQNVSGNSTTAVFGRVQLTNALGALLKKDVTITDGLVLETGSFNINDKFMTIGSGGSISAIPADSYSNSKMIYTNGFITTTKGLNMTLPAGTSQKVLFPIGTNGKYTPVEFNYTQSQAGTVNIDPINSVHVTRADKDRALQYYWIITSTGLKDFVGSVKLSYTPTDVLGDESVYFSARLSEATWTKVSGGVDAINHIATFPFSSSASDITGDYSAGEETALPLNVPTYTSNAANGDWGDINSWLPVPTNGVPSGAIMQIRAGDVIKLNLDGIKPYKTIINGTITAGSAATPTIGHNLGVVSGTGKIVVYGEKLPAGKYTTFFACGSGSLECSGTTNYTLSTIPTTLNQLILSGSGKRIIPAIDYSVCSLLDIKETAILDNSVNNRSLTLKGNFQRASGAAFLSGSGTINFEGDVQQQVSGFSGTNAFNNVVMNGAGGVKLLGTVDVAGDLTLTLGNINTSASALLKLTNAVTGGVSGGSSTSFVDGPLSKNINGGNTFEYPVGNTNRFGKVQITANNADYWIAQYYNHAASDDGYSAMNDVAYVSNNEYWSVTAPSTSSSAIVMLYWDANSGVNPSDANFKVAQWTDLATDAWKSIATTTTGGSTMSSGSATTSSISFTSFGSGTNRFAFASLTIPAYTWLGGTSEDWFTPSNWSSSVVPSSSSNVTIDKTGSYNPKISGTVAASTNTLNITSGDVLTLDFGGKLTVNGTITNSGLLILNHSTTQPSSFKYMQTVAVSNVRLNHQFAGESLRKWYVGHPITGSTYTDYTGSITDSPVSNYFAMASYNSPGWTLLAAGANFTDPMKGYGVQYRYTDKTAVHNGSLASATDYNIAFAKAGEQLVANPYPCYVDLDLYATAWDFSNVDNTVWMFTGFGATRNFVAYNITTGISTPTNVLDHYVAPMQGFFVKNSVAGTTFGIKKGARVHGDGGSLKAAKLPTNDVLRIQLSNSTMSDETVVVFREIGQEAFDGELDSEKFYENMASLPVIYSIKSGKKIAINLMPADPTPYVIPLGMTVGASGAGTLTLKISNIADFMPDMDVYLLDKTTGETANLREKPEYTFTTAAVTAENRFELSFAPKPVVEVPTDVVNGSADGIKITAIGLYNKAIVKVTDAAFTGNVAIEVLDAVGRLHARTVSGTTRTEVEAPSNTQFYIVKVTYKNKVQTFKIVTAME